jgi:hypothetical protein
MRVSFSAPYTKCRAGRRLTDLGTEGNEQDAWYDRNGRIVFTCSKALPGVGFSRPEWEKVRDLKSGTVSREIEDDTLPGGPRKRVITYEAPFDRCDREEDYKTAWAEFERRRAAKGAEA